MVTWLSGYFPALFSNLAIRNIFIFLFAVFFIDWTIHFFGGWLYKK
mgnify:CR=1 FL=1